MSSNSYYRNQHPIPPADDQQGPPLLRSRVLMQGGQWLPGVSEEEKRRVLATVNLRPEPTSKPVRVSRTIGWINRRNA